MSKFKEYLLEEKGNADKRKAEAKAKGLIHISFNNYKDHEDNSWFWIKSESRFMKLPKSGDIEL